MRDIVILDRGYPGGGATGRNVARIRGMQLTEQLTHVARACQAKYERMGEELALQRAVLPAGLRVGAVRARRGRADAAIVAMHHRIGVRSPLLAPDDTLRLLPVLRGGDPVAGAVLNDATRSSTTTPSCGRTSSTSRARGCGSCRASTVRGIRAATTA